MALNDLYSNAHLFFRWLHVIAGITWIGFLYFFNFINVPLQGALDDAAKKAVNAQLILRVLWWFRWAAMFTFIVGLILFTMNYMFTPGVGFGPSVLFMDESGITGRAVWIMLGMLMAGVMWFNVWFIIWPAQKGIFGGTLQADQVGGARKRAMLASRTNTFLSAPMLFAMLAPAHYTEFNFMTFLVFTLIGLGSIWWAIKTSYEVKATVS